MPAASSCDIGWWPALAQAAEERGHERHDKYEPRVRDESCMRPLLNLHPFLNGVLVVIGAATTRGCWTERAGWGGETQVVPG